MGKHDLGILKTTLLALIFRKLYRGFHIITVSEEIKKTLYKKGIIKRSNPIYVISNGVNIDFFHKTENSDKPEGLVAVYISRIEKIKGHEVLIRAWAQLKDISHKKLIIAGPDGLNGKMLKLAQDLDCADSIKFVGAISDPRQLLQNVNLGIFPSLKEGLPLALLEKMSMSLPVIVSDIPELTSIISDEKNGFIFKSGDSSDLAEKIRKLYKNPALALNVGKKARASVVSHYNFSDSLKKLEAVYSKLLNQKK